MDKALTKIYTAFITCRNKIVHPVSDKGTIEATVVLGKMAHIYAPNLEEAVRLAEEKARRFFPGGDGYFGHRVMVAEIPVEHIREHSYVKALELAAHTPPGDIEEWLGEEAGFSVSGENVLLSP